MNKPVDSKLLVPTIGYFINGKKAEATSTRSGEVTNPATGAVTKKVSFANAKDIDTAVQAAKAAFPAWRATPPLRRARVMQKFLSLMQANLQELAVLASEEHGKTVPDAVGSVTRGIEVIEFACGIPHLQKGERSEERRVGKECA